MTQLSIRGLVSPVAMALALVAGYLAMRVNAPFFLWACIGLTFVGAGIRQRCKAAAIPRCLKDPEAGKPNARLGVKTMLKKNLRTHEVHKAQMLSACALAALLFSCGPLAAAETEVVPDASVAPTLTVEQPANPVASKPGGPLLLSISARLGPQIALLAPQKPQTIIPEFHFVAPNGNAVLLHRELVTTSANHLTLNPSEAINIPAEAQKQGAVISGGWNCNTNPYYVKLRAWIMDADGNRSNEVQYTIHCNGG